MFQSVPFVGGALGGVEVVPEGRQGTVPLRLVGSLVRMGGEAAVTLRVEDGSSGEALWSHQFDLGTD